MVMNQIQQWREFDALAAFAAVAETGSFRAAGQQRGVSASAISHAVAKLEARLGLRLLNRTTRSVGLTAAGASLFDTVGPALTEIANAMEALNTVREQPRGRVRITAPRLAVATLLVPRLADFSARYSDIALEITVEDGFEDLAAGGFDAGIRFGESLSQDMIAVPVSGDLEMAVVASPAYLAARGVPETPDDLVAHACLQLRLRAQKAIYRWEFEKDGRVLSIAVPGNLILDDQEMIVASAINGAGLAYTTLDYARAVLDDGRLVRVLADWCPPFPGFFLYYPSRKHLAAALRAYIAFFRTT